MQLLRGNRRLLPNFATTCLVMALVLFGASVRIARAQDPDPQELLNKLNTLMQQVQTAEDPCMVMPKLKALINEVAKSSPEAYQAMKPSLDVINQDNSCSEAKPTDGAPADTAASQESTLTPEQQRQREAERKATLERLKQAEKRAAQQGTTQTTTLSRQGQPLPSSGSQLSCNDVTRSITLKVTALKGPGHCDGEVVGHFTSRADDIATCTAAFHHHGEWDDYGMGTIKPGQTTGGEMGGFWTCGADAVEIRYVCFLGDTPTDDKGHICNANIRWSD
jgi:hypothetical protein